MGKSIKRNTVIYTLLAVMLVGVMLLVSGCGDSDDVKVAKNYVSDAAAKFYGQLYTANCTQDDCHLVTSHDNLNEFIFQVDISTNKGTIHTFMYAQGQGEFSGYSVTSDPSQYEYTTSSEKSTALSKIKSNNNWQ